MKPGDLVRLSPQWEDVRLYNEPPDFQSFGMLTGENIFLDMNDFAIILESKEILEIHSTLTTEIWFKVLCSTGSGWLSRTDIELIQESKL